MEDQKYNFSPLMHLPQIINNSKFPTFRGWNLTCSKEDRRFRRERLDIGKRLCDYDFYPSPKCTNHCPTAVDTFFTFFNGDS